MKCGFEILKILKLSVLKKSFFVKILTYLGLNSIFSSFIIYSIPTTSKEIQNLKKRKRIGFVFYENIYKIIKK